MADEINSSNENINQRGHLPVRSNWAKIGIVFSAFAIIVTVCAFAIGYFQLANEEVTLARKISLINQQLFEDKQNINDIKKSQQDILASLQKAQNLSAQQEQLVSEWRAAQKGDMEKWRLAEAQYIVKIANDQLQFAHQPEMVIEYLQRADQVLAEIQDPNTVELRKALAEDLAKLQALPKIDLTGLYLKILAINDQLDQLPLAMQTKTDNQIETPRQEPTENLSWWREGLQRTWNGLHQIVIVRRTDAASLPLVLPDEKMFLYQNLHAQMEAVLWALLNRNNEIYQVNLARTMGWIQKYFDQTSSLTQNVLQGLEELRKIDIKPTTQNLASTLKLFEDVIAKHTQSAMQIVPATQVTTQPAPSAQAGQTTQ